MMDEQEKAGLERLRRLVAAESQVGKVLAAHIEDNPVCCISVDRRVPCVLLVWKQYSTSAQLRFVYESALDLLKKHRLSKILGDNTDLPTVHDEEQQWISANWMPRAAAAGLRFCAFKRSETHFVRVATDAIMDLAPAGLTLRSFDGLEETRRWLHDA